MGGQYVKGSLYFYAPNKEAPIIFGLLFMVSFVFHLRQCAKYKSWKITLMLPFCALTMGAGYFVREAGSFHESNVNLYIASMTIIYSAPPLYEMLNYLILSRLLYYVPYHSPLHPGRMLTTLAGISTVVETLNGNGVSYWANIKLSEHQQEMGRNFIKASLIVQLVVLVAFVTLTAFFQRRCKTKGPYPKNVKDVIHTLYFSAVLIGIRAIYRTVEYYTVSHFVVRPGVDPSSASVIIRYEAFFWIFEALLMLANSVLWNIRHPLRCFPADMTIYVAEDGITEKVGPGYADTRYFLIGMLDPFDLVGLCMGRNIEREFWKSEDGLNKPHESNAVKPAGEEEGDIEQALSVKLDDASPESEKERTNIVES